MIGNWGEGWHSPGACYDLSFRDMTFVKEPAELIGDTLGVTALGNGSITSGGVAVNPNPWLDKNLMTPYSTPIFHKLSIIHTCISHWPQEKQN